MSEDRPLDRLGWLERAIPETRRFCEEVERDAVVERAMAGVGSSSYDFEIDLNSQAVMARKTLALMEQERRSIVTRQRIRAEKQAQEEA